MESKRLDASFKIITYHIAEIREKDHPYGCVHRKLEDMPDEGRRSK